MNTGVRVFELELCLDICPGVRELDLMVILFLAFFEEPLQCFPL